MQLLQLLRQQFCFRLALKCADGHIVQVSANGGVSVPGPLQGFGQAQVPQQRRVQQRSSGTQGASSGTNSEPT